MAPEGAPDAISVERSADGSADTAASPLRTAVTPVPGVGQHLGESPGNHPGLRLEDQAQVVGAYLWIERRSFEILGSWVATSGVHLEAMSTARHRRYESSTSWRLRNATVASSA